MFKTLKNGLAVIILSLLFGLVGEAQTSESLTLEEMNIKLGQLRAQVEASDKMRAEERQKLEETLSLLETKHTEEIAALNAHHVRTLNSLEERFKEYKDHVAAVVGGKKPIFYQEITANKLLLGMGICSVSSFLTNFYYAYHETGSIFFGVFRALRDTLKDFVTIYYGAKIVEQVGTITSVFIAKAPQNPDKKDK